MSANAKYYIAWVAVILCFVLALTGLKNIQTHTGPDGFWGIGFLCTGAGVGMVAAGVLAYFREQRFRHKDMQQVAAETLAALARQQQDDMAGDPHHAASMPSEDVPKK